MLYQLLLTTSVENLKGHQIRILILVHCIRSHRVKFHLKMFVIPFKLISNREVRGSCLESLCEPQPNAECNHNNAVNGNHLAPETCISQWKNLIRKKGGWGTKRLLAIGRDSQRKRNK